MQIIISDLHLGSKNCNTKALNKLLDINFDQLILNGDIVNSLNFNKFTKDHWTIFNRIRENNKVIFIQGNHDSYLSVILNKKFHNFYEISVKNQKYCVTHGDFFDPTLNWPIVTDIADWCYQKIDKKSGKVLKKLVKRYLGVLHYVQNLSINYAKHKGYDGIITGHTHFADNLWSKGIHYLNSGCWTEEVCHFIQVNDDKIELIKMF